MIRTIVFVGLQYALSILFTVWLIYIFFKLLPKKIKEIKCEEAEGLTDKDFLKKEEAWQKWQLGQGMEYYKLFLKIRYISMIPILASILATFLDGIGNRVYLENIVISVAAIVGGCAVLLMKYLEILTESHHGEGTFVNGILSWTSVVIPIMVAYSIVVAQTAYATVGLFM